MKYSVKVTPFEKDKLKGLASVKFEDKFVVNNIKIYEHQEKGLWVYMPNYKTNEKDENGKEVYKDIANPTTKEFREELYKNIIAEYKVAVKAKQQEKEQNTEKNKEMFERKSFKQGFVPLRQKSRRKFSKAKHDTIPNLLQRKELSINDTICKCNISSR